MKILGINSSVTLNGTNLKIVGITKKGVLFSNKLELYLEDILNFLNNGVLKVISV